MNNDILKNLNESQLKAATHLDGPMLILAGAGSGKTKTITSRLAYLISLGIDPNSILTLTFTNKASNEMRRRAMNLLNKNVINPPLLCTFHKFGLLFLKFHISELGRKNNFSIIDMDDKKRIIKNFESDIPTSVLSNEFSKYKNSLLSQEEITKSNLDIGNIEKKLEEFYSKTIKFYKLYEEYLEKNNLVDFDDLLILPYKILDKNKKLCSEISNMYNYIMVDEYQDTNEPQFKLLQKLCSNHDNLCVVGDDDQSIYGWRGAKVENILNFKEQFKNVKVIKLENNYRSTDEILVAANNVINHNRNRLGKTLISTKGKGENVNYIESYDESVESLKISEKILKLIASGVNLSEIAILYRVNALSRSVEDGLRKAKIPYKMVGGLKFYERSEIKDIISYLRLVFNENDDFSLNRIINKPKRGLGKVSLAKIETIAKDNKTSIFNALTNLNESVVAKKSFLQLNEFIDGIKTLQSIDATFELIDKIEEIFDLKSYYEAMPDGMQRVANIDEFYAMLKDEIKSNPDFSLEEFLNELTLQSDQDLVSEDSVCVMSIHASKGLEFEHLFVIGLEEGFFPIISENCDIEEERRLAYVAITRAKKTLTLSNVESRFYKGKRERLKKSRFLSEAGVCEGSLVIEKSSDFKKGDLVKHKLFGIGRITEATKMKNDVSKLKINFGGMQREIISSFVEKVI